MKDKAIPAVIGEKVCWYRVLDVQESEEVAIEPVIIPLATAAGAALCIVEDAVSIFSKIVLLPAVSVVPVIERRRHFIPAVIMVSFP